MSPGATLAETAALPRLPPWPGAVTVEVSRQDTALTNVLTERGFREDEGPWFAQLRRDLADLPGRLIPDGYSIRLVGRDELAERCVLFEPVGTDPDHGRRGLARAVCAEILHRARELGHPGSRRPAW